jgi:hypothetical protein
MYALGVRNLPEGPGWLYEIKLDGYRSLACCGVSSFPSQFGKHMAFVNLQKLALVRTRGMEYR